MLVALARTAAIALAILACAWYALGVRQAHELNAATGILSQPAPLPTAQAMQASALLGSAATLNPDLQVDVLRAQLALARNQDARARQILFGVIRREPKNLEAWIWYARAAGSNARAFYAAEAGIARLAPGLR